MCFVRCDSERLISGACCGQGAVEGKERRCGDSVGKRVAAKVKANEANGVVKASGIISVRSTDTLVTP